jgi:hypothetical protein
VEKLFFEHSYVYPPSPPYAVTNSQSKSSSATPWSSPSQTSIKDATILTPHSLNSGDSLSDARRTPTTSQLAPSQASRDRNSPLPASEDGECECESPTASKGPPAYTTIQGLVGVRTITPPEAGCSASQSPHSERSVSSETDSSLAKLDDSESPTLSSRPAAPDGEVTRIEITFNKLYRELLSSRDHDALIQEVAGRVATSSIWSNAFDAYQDAARWSRLYSGSGTRKNRFMDIMNLIVQEAPKCGLEVPYVHELRYGRYHYDGSEWRPDEPEKDESSEDEARGKEPFQSGLSVCSCGHRIKPAIIR